MNFVPRIFIYTFEKFLPLSCCKWRWWHDKTKQCDGEKMPNFAQRWRSQTLSQKDRKLSKTFLSLFWFNFSYYKDKQCDGEKMPNFGQRRRSQTLSQRDRKLSKPFLSHVKFWFLFLINKTKNRNSNKKFNISEHWRKHYQEVSKRCELFINIQYVE